MKVKKFKFPNGLFNSQKCHLELFASGPFCPWAKWLGRCVVGILTPYQGVSFQVEFNTKTQSLYVLSHWLPRPQFNLQVFREARQTNQECHRGAFDGSLNRLYRTKIHEGLNEILTLACLQ